MEKQKIKLNRKVLKKEKESEIKIDIIVPDIKPDIVAIINTNANAYIYKEEILNGKIRLDGNVDSYVVYLSETGETRSLTVNIDFVESIEDEQIAENMIFKTKVKLQSIETKILNERKISVIARIALYAEFYESTEIEFLKSSEDDCSIQKMEKEYSLKSLVGCNKSKASVKEDITIDAIESIAEILKTEVSVTNYENKVSYNKVLAKADANIKIVYQTEEMKIGVADVTYPVMSFIDIENIEESHICETEFKLRNMLFKINTTESNKVLAQLDFETYVEVYKTQEMTIIQDLYSLEKEIEFSKKEIEVSLEGQVSREIIQVNEKVIVEDINNIIDVSTDIIIVSKTTTGTYINYELNAVLDIMYETDNRNTINSRTIKLPFMAKLETQSDNVDFEICKKEIDLNDEELNCNLEIECKLYKDNSTKISVLENVVEKDCEIKNEYSMIVYFVKPCDTIWKIAKMFKVTPDSIREANDLDCSDKVYEGQKLYIVK